MNSTDILAIKAQLLDIRLRPLLQIYCDRYLQDPEFLVSHRLTLTLILRHSLRLGIDYGTAPRDGTAEANLDLKIFEALTLAIQERLSEQNSSK